MDNVATALVTEGWEDHRGGCGESLGQSHPPTWDQTEPEGGKETNPSLQQTRHHQSESGIGGAPGSLGWGCGRSHWATCCNQEAPEVRGNGYRGL